VGNSGSLIGINDSNKAAFANFDDATVFDYYFLAGNSFAHFDDDAIVNPNQIAC
jgi:hypothetical protein